MTIGYNDIRCITIHILCKNHIIITKIYCTMNPKIAYTADSAKAVPGLGTGRSIRGLAGWPIEPLTQLRSVRLAGQLPIPTVKSHESAYVNAAPCLFLFPRSSFIPDRV